MKRRRWLAAGVVLLGVAGCRAYRERPLELSGYAEAWSARPLDLEPIRDYARELVGEREPAPPFDGSDGLTLTEAEAVALHFNPRLRLVRSQAEVPLAGAREAGWWPDPQFEAEFLRFLNRGSRGGARFQGPSLDGVNTQVLGANGLNPAGLEFRPPGYRRTEGDFVDDPLQVGVGLSFTLPLSGRLAVERDLQWSSYRAAWRQVLIAEWELLTELRARWLEWSAATKQVAMTQDYLERLAGIADIAGQLVEAGTLKRPEVRVLDIELARRRAALGLLNSTVEQQRLMLLSLLGLAPDAAVQLHSQIFVAPDSSTPPEERRALVLSRHPRLQAVRAEYEVAEQSLRLEIRRQYPDLQIGPSFSFEEGFSRLGFGFGLPLPLWNRNRQAIAEALAERETARVRAQAEVELVLSELARVEARLRQADRRRDTLLQEVGPLVDRQLEDSRTLLELGEVDVLLLRDALTGSLETRLDILDATLAQAQAASELAQMARPQWFTPSQDDPQENR